MNRPYLHSLLAGAYKQLRELDEQIAKLTQQRSDTFAQIEKSELEFDDLGSFKSTPPTPEG